MLRLFLILIFLAPVFVRAQVKQETISLNHTDLYYEVYGSGEPLLLLHGWVQSGSYWKPFINDFMDTYEVYVPDLHGHGNSGILRDDFSIQSAAMDILLMMDKLGLEQVRIIGFSFGGILALELANRHPDRIEAMVVIGAVYDFNGAEQNQGEFNWRELPPEYINYLYEIHPGGEAQVEELFSSDTNYKVHITRGELQNIRVKTLVISGDRDTVAGWKTAVELHDFLPNSQLWMIPDKGHTPLDKFNHQEFVNNVFTFFSEMIR
ncbi:alpha/beta fold hydrolase [Fulvivirga sedimenti]|uniref:Alpha/beta hydrolase n=1 Tax=Fulvivirga sedimenti TaxID=2879465 RepID=A0A9X1KXE1_9BACT|nr:alpha/beta hydrolase [Fulvivirga sedimenti]MCA6074117.1 alpha/beta hydrolase [Fulvivirga sedimenti]